MRPALDKQTIEHMYVKERLSAKDIASRLCCSEHKVHYWLAKHRVPKRSISEAVYLVNNPTGDPFYEVKRRSHDDVFLYGLGLGLYWGEGTKRNKNAVRLGNTDPMLVRAFIAFLERCFGVAKNDLRFGLQVFSDIDPIMARMFWMEILEVRSDQFYKKIVCTKSGKMGTYRRKIPHGVLTVYFNNTRLQDRLVSRIEEISKMY
jgi:hypothetical protein